jgi:hypothetical protein
MGLCPCGTVIAQSSQGSVEGTLDTAWLTDLKVGDYVVVGAAKNPEHIGIVQNIVSDAFIYLDVPIGNDLDDVLYKVSWEKRPCSKRAWEDRFSMISGEVCLNDGFPVYTIDPAGTNLIVYPNIVESDDDSWVDRFTIVWDGIKAEWEDGDATKFDQATVGVVADFVKGECARHFNQDIQTWATFCQPPDPARRLVGGTYHTGKARLYRDELRRS